MTDARDLTQTLRGKWYRRYGAAPCPVCQPEGRREQNALTLTESGGRLLLHCKKSGCGFRDILAAAGIAPGAVTAPDSVAQREAEAKRKAEAEKRSAQASRLWQDAQPVAGTLAENYLRARGISCLLPETLRYAPACWHVTAKRFPALVALVDGAEACAVHRTYLRADGTGKAEVNPDKAMLGGTQGGAVRLSEGPGPLVVCEGIETGLSLLSGLLRAPAMVRAALSTSGIRGLRLPPQPGKLTIASDGDAPGRDAAKTLAGRARRAGWAVFLGEAPEGSDWNDVLRDTEGAA